MRREGATEGREKRGREGYEGGNERDTERRTCPDATDPSRAPFPDKRDGLPASSCKTVPFALFCSLLLPPFAAALFSRACFLVILVYHEKELLKELMPISCAMSSAR